MLKKLIAALLAVVVLLVNPTFANITHRESDDKLLDGYTYRYSHIKHFTNSFKISNSGLAEMDSDVYAYGADRTKLIIYLQKYQNGAWTTLKRWSETDESNHCSLSKKMYLLKGYQYRMKSYCYVYQRSAVVEYDYYLNTKAY